MNSLFDDLKVNHQATSDDCYTPSWVFDQLGLEFDLDPAHPPFKTNVPCKRWYTVEDDGLEQPWEGRVWLNPPFSKTTPWVRKFMQHGNGVALLPWAKSQWCRDLMANHEGAVVMPLDEIKFDKNKTMHPIFSPVFLFALGDDNTKALENLGRVWR